MNMRVSFAEENSGFRADFGETSILHDGQNGATFTPAVSADGVISWTNDRDLPNPAPVNIKGKDGAPGEKGEPGERGLQGIQGEKGEKGDPGEPGKQGIQGVPGEKGEKGDPGKDGVDGQPGKDGKDGQPGADGISPIVTVQDISGGHRVTITDAEGAKEFDVMDGKDGAGGSGGDAVQSDWEQNDETAPDFVKNRPFYSYTETTLTQAVLASGTYTSEFIADYGAFAAIVMTDSTVEQDEPCYYNVTVDGAEYKNLVKYSPADGSWLLGNGSILAPLFDALGIETPADTGEPFVMLVNNDAIWTDVLLVTDFTQSTTHEMTLTYCKETSAEITKKLPEKYYDAGVGARWYDEVGREGGEIFNCYEGTDANFADGNYSHAEGSNTNANGDCSHAEGRITHANGDCSHAEGSNTHANGDCSHAEGRITHAYGASSHAEGSNTNANGDYSHAEGYETYANGYYSHAEGKYNILDENGEGGKYVHIVGNGVTTRRSNAHTLDWEGNAWYAGDVYVGSTSGTNKDDGSVKLVANGDDHIVLTSPNGTKYKITVSDDGTLTAAAQ